MKWLKVFVICTSMLVVVPLIGCSADRGLPVHHDFFEKYKTKPHYRALSFTGSYTRTGSMSGYSSSASSVEEAIERALQTCEEGKKKYAWEKSIGDCKLYAIGDIVVHGMSPEELETATQNYENDVASGRVGDHTSVSDSGICNFAITMNDGTANWESRPAWLKYVNEAKRRDLTPEQCAELLDR